ncbi:hypothetical protein Taro_056261 [Colocasia esculenta]|uniref:Tyrosinase copper-binding domain-containing protein n=1 Tax=Colocasia esculenta TaxID=4460 RepID=A0A843XT25_COLES|nr:hypothetical protein [Colocasia esculenta]
MQRPLCVAVLVLLLVFLLGANWIRSGPDASTGDITGDNRPVLRQTLAWIEHYTVLLLGVLVGSLEQPPTHGSGGPRTRGTDGEPRHGSPLAANLSICYPSLSDGDRPVYCCPPRPDGAQTVVDFEYPANTDSFPLRIRRPAHLVDDVYIAKYERAVAIMKSLPSDHPHNFFRQANNHCLYCTGSYNQVNSTALFKIHRSWLFFPWHRAFLYFHERILGRLIGDNAFALSYWNWDAPEGMVMPGLYTTGALNHTERDESHLPPQISDLNYECCVPVQEPAEEQVATNLAFMYHQMVSGAKKPELFLGCKLRSGTAGACDGPGTVESAPHNTVHTWVGSERNPEREDMGAFYSAARDPLFFAHHANIDRLWQVWKELMGLQDQPDFDDPDWLETSFTFYDENLQLVRIKVRDCLDPTKLGYTYEETALRWLDARPKPAVPPEVARGILMKRNDGDTSRLTRTHVESVYATLEAFDPAGRALDATITAKVRRPDRSLLQQTLGEGRADGSEEEEVLVVYGIQVEGDKYAKFDVFVNLVANEETAGPRSREFAGTFVNVPRGARRTEAKQEGDAGAGAPPKVTLKLGISELLQDLEAGEDDSVWVSLVPRGGSGARITVDGIRIEYMR